MKPHKQYFSKRLKNSKIEKEISEGTTRRANGDPCVTMPHLFSQAANEHLMDAWPTWFCQQLLETRKRIFGHIFYSVEKLEEWAMGIIDEAGCPEPVEDFRTEQVDQLFHQAWAEWGNYVSQYFVSNRSLAIPRFTWHRYHIQLCSQQGSH